jgi:AraC-like DNA-binding protein
MEKLARARIVMWEGASLWIVDAATAISADTRRTDFHKHHAIQATLSLGGWFTISTRDALMRDEAVIVAADTEHLFDAEGLVATLFIEPESNIGRAVKSRFFTGRQVASIPLESLDDFPGRIAAEFRHPSRDDIALANLGRDLIMSLGTGVAVDQPDLRISKVIDWISREIDGPISQSDAVAIGDLSASRFRHLFVEQTGLPFKTYVLWLRLTRAVKGYAAGATLTQAAHQAGFADSAHLSRTFRRMFGIAPASLSMV